MTPTTTPQTTPPGGGAPAPVDTLGYVRVSTEQQAGEERVSLPEQRRAIERRAAQMRRAVGAWFEDPGASGATAEGRPGFRALLAYCEAHPRPRKAPGLVLVLNDSRFGRFDDPEEATYWRHALKRLGWVVRFCEGDDVEDAVGRGVMRFIGSAQASEYRANIRRTAKRSLAAAAARGRWMGEAPLGYRRLATRASDGAARTLERGQRKSKDEVVTLTPGPAAEVEAVRYLYARYATGTVSMRELQGEMRARYPGMRRWTFNSVREVLLNPVYGGAIVWGRRPVGATKADGRFHADRDAWQVFEGTHPALVDAETLAQVRARRPVNREARRATGGGYPLSGLVRCGRCGSGYIGGGGRAGPPEDPDRYRFYRDPGVERDRCERPAGRGGASLGATVIRKRWLEGAVIDAIASVLRDPRVTQVIREEMARAVAEAAGESPAARRAEAERDRKRLVAQRERVVAAIAAGTLSDAEAAATLAQLRAELAAAEGRLEAVRFAERRRATVGVEVERLVQMALDFPTAARRLSGAALREVVRPWLAEAVVDPAARVLRLVIRRVPVMLLDGLGSQAGQEHPEHPARRVRQPDRRRYAVRQIALPAPADWPKRGKDLKPRRRRAAGGGA